MYIYFIIGILSFVIGMLIGVIFIKNKNNFGTLFIDSSDESKDLYKIEIENLDNLNNKKMVMLKIKHTQK